ncbi:hypothetical protein NV379_09910 [Paenibacillus sp. N1-5-1-14]|uniref:hypothetical protein n=1 Tax=Paenibacillus radicibacter TaxID=2972488 RepID=UPI002158A4F2|nr:hypothetical protein [Paenibacillus radicibacter]MCR8642974.1 hypothetical protein [Paenibacillus radicibacter]
MDTRQSPMHEINLIGKLADLKEDNYHNGLMISALIDLLITKQVFTREEFQAKMDILDASFAPANPPTSPTV